MNMWFLLALVVVVSPFVFLLSRARGPVVWIQAVLLLICTQLGIGLITQALHIFMYPVVLILTILATSGSVFLLWRQTKDQPAKGKRFDWVVLLIIGLAVLHLSAVHYQYTGKISQTLHEGY